MLRERVFQRIADRLGSVATPCGTRPFEPLFEEARRVPGGALPRGPQRWYVEVHPERIRGFVDIATHPWFVAACEAVLGADYRIVEVGVDAPDAANAGHHDLRITRGYALTLPPRVLEHLTYRLVDQLGFVVQHHVIEGLLEPAY